MSPYSYNENQKGYYPWARLFDYLFLQPVLIGKNSLVCFETHFFILFFDEFYNYHYLFLST